MQDLPDNVVRLNFAKPKKEVPPASAEKRTIFGAFLEEGIVAVVLDPRGPGCQIPPDFRDDEQLVLNFCYAYNINDFAFDDDGIGATLAFPQGYFYCFVPWHAVLAMHSDAMQKSAFWNE
jgi:hypothetical protein